MTRQIIEIDEALCTGCGLCAKACHEGAIAIVNGKAKLLRDDFCDGFGDCLPQCPEGAIRFIEREAAAYDESAVAAAKALRSAVIPEQSALKQWPVQIQLVPTEAPYFENTDVLIAADCTAYAYARFHEDFMRNKVTLIGCTKLDSVDYSEKLREIFAKNTIRSVTVARMKVNCCGGMETAVRMAILFSGKKIPLQISVIDKNGNIVATR